MFKKTLIIELVLVFIITIPAFVSLLNSGYFPMHDDQHIARLFLLDQGIRQGSLYPRWLGGLGFGFGYPLFNFYPPLIYYVSEFFHSLGFSLILSIKVMIITGFVVGAFGLYLLAKHIIGKAAAILSTTLFTYFTYHAVLVYVRGAFAEFFALSILPFVFLFIIKTGENPKPKNAILFGISLALLILAHPLIAFPAFMYIGILIVWNILRVIRSYFAKTSQGKPEEVARGQNLLHSLLGIVLGLALSAFFWLPSMIERRFTMVDSILLTELANYKIHFVYPFQFWFSQWGYGGSLAGPFDGMSFQLGKIHILLVVVAFLLSILYFFHFKNTKKEKTHLVYFHLFLGLLIVSLFMSISLSQPLWDRIQFLWYLQFPWRFLTFATVFMGLCGGFVIFFTTHIYERLNTKEILAVIALGISFILIVQYTKYFKPQRLLTTTDSQQTTFDEISWRISNTSFEFVPKGVKTKKSNLNTTVFDIDKKNLPQLPFNPNSLLSIQTVKNDFAHKEFHIEAEAQSGTLQLNTFNFPGWHAYVNGNEVAIGDDNPYKLITIDVPQGLNEVSFSFKNTPIRSFANSITLLSFLGIVGYFIRIKAQRRV